MSEKPIAFDLWQDKRRRIVLGALAEEQRSLTLDELTGAILRYNHQMLPTEASEDVLREIRLSLYHVHLPKLASEGFINYDPEQQLVEPAKQLDQVKQTLSTVLDDNSTLEAPIEL